MPVTDLDVRQLGATILYAREATDPLRQFRPHAKQTPFIAAVLGTDTYENWFCAANRAGKSDAGVYCDAHLARFGIPNPKPAIGASGIVVYDRATAGWVVGPTHTVMQQVLQPKLFNNGLVAPGQAHEPFIPQREIEAWYPSTKTLKLKNGSLQFYKSNDQQQDTFAAAGIDYVHFDEEPLVRNYDECTLRVEAGQRLRIYGTCTLLPPEGTLGGVSWVYPRIIQPFTRGVLQGLRVFGASIYDNPYLSSEEIDRLESRYPEGSVQRRIRLGGEWLPGLSGARKYGNFDALTHVEAQPPLASFKPLCWCWDFNVEPFITLVGQLDERMFRFYDELVLEEGNILEMVDLFRSRYPQHGAELWIYGDQTGMDRSHQTRLSSYTIILEALRTYPAPTRLKVPSVNPGVVDRVNAFNMALRTPRGERQVSISPKCVELIADCEQVIDDGHGGIKKTHNRKDPYARRTHASDAAGYWISKEAPVRPSPTKETSTVPIPRPQYRWQQQEDRRYVRR